MNQSQVNQHPTSLLFQTLTPQLDYDVSQQRRSANYKPSLWKNDFLESLSSKYDRKEYTDEAERLVKEVKNMFSETEDLKVMLELIDSIKKLGLSFHFVEEVKTCLDKIENTCNIINTPNYNVIREDLYVASLCFRLLRQHGYAVSQDMLDGFRDKVKGISELEKVMVELLEASNVGFEGENTLDEAKAFAAEILTTCFGNDLASHALELPWHWRVDWFDVKWQVNVREKNVSHVSNVLVALAKLQFNVVQASLQRDLRKLSCWWKNIGVTQKVDFARDRLVESFMCSVGLAHQPQDTCLRMCLTKVVNFILIIDDVYDLYGSLEELKHFTNAVDRWDFTETQNLPDCMKICFQALHDTTCDIAKDIETEVGHTLVLPHHFFLQWAGFCKSLLVEAEWDHNGYIPSFHEYLSNAWISSSGPLLFVHSYFSARHEHTHEDISDFLKENHDLMYNISLIIRLCNDIGTSKAEQERGDAPSSIMCYMKETNASEDVTRKHIQGMIASAWKKINMKCFTPNTITNDVSPFVNIMLNIARVAHNLYQSGDAFGVQVSDNKKRIMPLLVEPFVAHI